MNKALALATGMTLSMMAGAALAQTTKAAPAAAPTQVFVKEAVAGGMAEVELGQLAAQKASNDEVKKFGQRMVDDHSKADDELKQMASQKKIAVPTDLDAKDKALKTRLSRLSGPAFDRAYMQAMITDHVKDVSMFKTQANAAKDPDVKAFAAKTLPVLEDHLTMARNTDKQVVGTSTKK